jgi:hypothetical protein
VDRAIPKRAAISAAGMGVVCGCDWCAVLQLRVAEALSIPPSLNGYSSHASTKDLAL